jgi:hypothetical protein
MMRKMSMAARQPKLKKIKKISEARNSQKDDIKQFRDILDYTIKS